MSNKILIFGNSGSGKTTLANKISEEKDLPYLDLDTLAWKKENPTERRLIEDSENDIVEFINKHKCWVIEGCYSSLVTIAANYADNLIFLNPGIETCVNNCLNRPFEPHKYKSKEEQDKNLEMLVNWVKQYEVRDDEYSLIAHKTIFNSFKGVKKEITSQSY